MRATVLTVAVVALLLGMAGHAAADTKAYDVALMEGQDCPDQQAMCIEIEAANDQADGSVEDPYANLTIVGAHPIVLNVTNEGTSVHNLTFEPGTEASNYSEDDPLMPGDSVNITLTTVEDVPAGEYLFYSGQGADRQLGMVGELLIEPGNATGDGAASDGPDDGADDTAREDDAPAEDDTAGEGNVTPEEDAVPGPGAALTVGALTAGLALAARRRG